MYRIRAYSMRLTALALLAALLGLPAAAAGQDTPWYDVEVIVFAYTAEKALRAEAWPDDPELPNLQSPRTLAPSGASGLTPFQTLPSGERRLNDTYQRLRSSSQTEPLAHLAWRQPGLERNQAVPVRVRVEAGAGSTGGLPRLDGSVTLILSRYLHMATDLVYRAEDETLVRETEFQRAPMERQPPGRRGELTQTGPAVYSLTTGRSAIRELVIRDSRRMRSGELHYLDHPVVGVLVQVRPYKESASSR